MNTGRNGSQQLGILNLNLIQLLFSGLDVNDERVTKAGPSSQLFPF
jgi:hypothetical protein